MMYRFKKGWSTADRDKAVFTEWERGNITTTKAAEAISDNNRCDLSVEEFVELANSLGYRRD